MSNEFMDSRDAEIMPTLLERGRVAFETLRQEASELPNEILVAPNTNVGDAAIGALGVIAAIREPELYQRFESLPPGEFDIECVAALDNICHATLFVANLIEDAREAGFRRIPSELLQRAKTLEERMRACCEYYLGDRADLAPVLAKLRRGAGHIDLAERLLGYATLYREHGVALSADPKHYRDSDADDAAHIGQEMMAMLGLAERDGLDVTPADLSRMWTLLVRVYGEVAATGRWLFRSEPVQAQRRFPSLVALGRTGRAWLRRVHRAQLQLSQEPHDVTGIPPLLDLSVEEIAQTMPLPTLG